MDQFVAPISTPVTPEPKVRKDIANLYFLLDKSGSMWSMQAQAIDGFNKYIGAQRELEGLTRVTLVQFSSGREVSYSNLDVMQVPVLDQSTYQPSGGTALNDAVGHILSNHVETNSEDETNIIAILTDGFENASTEYKLEDVRALIARAEAKGWEVLFLGANMTKDTVVNTYGISASNVSAFDASAKGMSDAFTTLSATTSSYRGMKSRGISDKVDVEAVYAATATATGVSEGAKVGVSSPFTLNINNVSNGVAAGYTPLDPQQIADLLAKATQPKP